MRRIAALLFLLLCRPVPGQLIPVSPLTEDLDGGQKGQARVAAFGGGFLATWISSGSVYVAPFDAAGKPATRLPSRIADGASGYGVDVTAGATGYLLIYQRADWAIVLVRLSPEGVVVESRTLLPVQSYSIDPFFIRDGDRIQVRLETASGTGPQRAARLLPIDPFGTVTGSAVEAPCMECGIANDGRAAAFWDEQGNLHVAKRTDSGWTTRIRATEPPERREYPALATTAGGYLAVWQTYTYAESKIQAIRLDAEGVAISPIVTLATAPYFLTTSIEALALGGERVAVTWKKHDQLSHGFALIVDGTTPSAPVRLGDGPTGIAWNGSVFGLATSAPGFGRAVISVATASPGLASISAATPVSIGVTGHRLIDAVSNGNTIAVLWTIERANSPILLGGSILSLDGRTLRAIELPQLTTAFGSARLATNGRDFLVVWSEDFGSVYARMIRDNAPVLKFETSEAGSVDAAWNGSEYLVAWIGENGNALHVVPLTDDGVALHPGTDHRLEPRRGSGPLPAYRGDPHMALGNGSLLMTWNELTCSSTGCEQRARASEMTRDGVILDPEGIDLGGSDAVVAFDGRDFVIAMTDSPPALVRVHAGQPVAVASRTALPSIISGFVESVAVARDGEVLATWVDPFTPRRAVRFGRIRGARVTWAETTNFLEIAWPAAHTVIVPAGPDILLFGTVLDPVTPRVYMKRYAAGPAPAKRRSL